MDVSNMVNGRVTEQANVHLDLTLIHAFNLFCHSSCSVHRAVNPSRHQMLRIDREGMIDDITLHDK